MRVAIVNGSHNKNGCTARALAEVAKTLEEEGIGTEGFWIGGKSLGGCMGCNACLSLGRCVIDDRVNDFLKVAERADGFVFGAPVHYSHAGASLLGFMDRLFYLSGGNAEGAGGLFAHKPAAAVVAARRSGTTASFEDVNQFFAISQMPIVTSTYWNNVHGDDDPSETEQDVEGLRVMRILARNMAWMLRCIEAGRAAGVEPPGTERGPWTSFIR